MQLTMLKRDAFDARYRQSFVQPDRISVGDLEREWESLRDRYRAALARHWTEDCFGEADFAISDDWHTSFYHCGGLTSPRVVCPLFPETIVGEMKRTSHWSQWSFHATVTIEGGSEAELLIDHSGIFAPGDCEFDYRRFIRQ